LQGGNTSFPNLNITLLRAASNNLFSEPVTVEYLYTAANLPQVLVNVSNVTSKCEGNCSYQVLPPLTPILNSAVLNVDTLTLNVSDPGEIGFTLAQINVTVAGTRCRTNIGYSISQFSCTLDHNTDGSPILETGSYTPQVEVVGVGFAAPVSDFVNISVSLTVNSSTVTTSGLSGGLPVGIIGNGFPFTATDPTFSVTLCGVPATVTSVSNTQIGIIAPPCTAANAASSIVVAYAG
jgi:hypothetical protein